MCAKQLSSKQISTLRLQLFLKNNFLLSFGVVVA